MNIEELNAEIADVIKNFHPYHSEMAEYLSFYQNSAFYKPRKNQKIRKELHANMLKVFADKNIHYTSPFPKIKIPSTPENRENGNIREKALYAVHTKNNSHTLQRRYARDATLLSVAINEVMFDRKRKCVVLKRHDPRRCFWRYSDDGQRTVSAFWTVFPITKTEAKNLYGVTPESNGGLPEDFMHRKDFFKYIDGQDWFLQAIKWTGTTRTAWVGDKIVEEEHNHNMGGIPIDVCMPFDELSDNDLGSFYLRSLVPLQAELNDVIRQKASITHRMANPVVWGRNIVNRHFDDVKRQMERPGGGFVGLGRTGELGLLQVNDVKMLSDHELAIFNNMMKISGFSAASFGESVGANTSGDALSMYFTPTQRLIEDQNIAWIAFWQSINKKILRAYDKNLTRNQKVKLSGYAPGGTIKTSDDGEQRYQSDAVFSVEFGRENIAGDYNSIVIPKNITPKDELKEKEWALQAVSGGLISRVTAYEQMGLISPEDELALLEQEKSNPLFNPEGTNQILQPQQPESQPQLDPAQGVDYGSEG